MAKAPGNAANFDGSGSVWFKVHEISAVTDGGKTISFPSSSASFHIQNWILDILTFLTI